MKLSKIPMKTVLLANYERKTDNMINGLMMSLKGYKKIPLRDTKGILTQKNNFVWTKVTQNSHQAAGANAKIERIFLNGSRLVKSIVAEPAEHGIGQFFVSKSGKFWRSLKMGEDSLEIIVGRVKNGVEQAEKFFQKQNGKISSLSMDSVPGIRLNTLK